MVRWVIITEDSRADDFAYCAILWIFFIGVGLSWFLGCNYDWYWGLICYFGGILMLVVVGRNLDPYTTTKIGEDEYKKLVICDNCGKNGLIILPKGKNEEEVSCPNCGNMSLEGKH